MAPIIGSVLKNIAQKSVERLPSYGLTCLESVQAQLRDCLSETDGFTTLQTDGTTKFGDHYTTYDIRTESSSYIFWLINGYTRNTKANFG